MRTLLDRLSSALPLVLAAQVGIPLGLEAQAQSRIQPDSLRRAVITEMKQGLRELVTLQSQHHERSHSFATSLAPSAATTPTAYSLRIPSADSRGWTGVATANAEPTLHCGIFVGAGVAPNAAVVAPTVPACWSVVGANSMVTE